LFKGLIVEMFKRYRHMEQLGVRNIASYNAKSTEKMPYLVLVVDELADLMMTASVEVEQTLCRLAQLGRATGIHLIIATQRPSVDVLTGLIKANFPSRIAFGVTSHIDSRTILDSAGAEKLLGRGDMLYQPIDASRPGRVQGVFISDDEISDLVGYWEKTPWAPMPKVGLEIPEDEEQGDEKAGAGNTGDDLMDRAMELAYKERKLSTSLLQRRLRIGYPRAARLMDELEDQGIVGPSDGSKSRDVIIG
ncbi:MAG: DNA translocase FtsK, partial [Proteobacteria bacterium]|nr:DNA translocase FtsK [Pseudomonadota bacterium]